MPIIPPQIRSADPWSENRFSNNFNLRNRIYTLGENVIVKSRSFSLSIVNNMVRVGPGMCFIDDVFIHIPTSFTLNPLDVNYYFSETSPVVTGKILICLEYEYMRVIPPPRVYAGFVTLAKAKQNLKNRLYIGLVVLEDGQIKSANRAVVVIDPNTIIQTRIVEIPAVNIEFNGGVIDYSVEQQQYVWVDNWL